MNKSLDNEAINVFTFNKSKKESIILIHGLFGNSGYWLPFLTYFSKFKILILDINYSKIFTENPDKINFHNFFESILENDKDCTLISHSMGTVIAQFFPQKKVKTSYEICPIKNSIKNNKTNFLIGTHALFQKTIEFNKLGLVVIDEQHKFGVQQRINFAKKGGSNSDVLLMSATPIPRTMMMSIYGDMDTSRLMEKPVQRKKTIT